MVATVAVVLGPAMPRLVDASSAGPVAPVQIAVGLLAAGLACSGVFHWRATGWVAGVWVAGMAAVMTLAMVVNISVESSMVGGAAASGATAVAGAHLVVASASPQIDSAVTPHRVVPAGLLAGLVAAWLAVWTQGAGADFVLGLAVATWLVVLLMGGVNAWVGGSLLLGWAAVGAAPMALAEMISLPEAQAVMPVVLKPVLQGVGLVVIGAGTTFDLARSVRWHRSETLDREVLQRTVEESRRMATEDRNHDLGNALMALEGATLTLASCRGELTVAQQTQLAEAVARETEQVRRLTLAEEAGREMLRLDLRGLVDRQAVLARANGATVEVDGLDAAPVDAPDGDIQQILHNLFSNARRHGGAGRDSPVRVRVCDHEDVVAVIIEDDGPGVPAAIRDEVFTRGVRDRASTGDGLGLAVSRGLARQHGGDLRLLPSADGSGARFELSLPAAESPVSV